MGSDREQELAAKLVGVLALQGDFDEHAVAMQRCGFRTRLIRDRDGLHGLDAIVLPGGESSTMLRLLAVEGLWQPLGLVLRSGIPVLGTCAGMILLADEVQGPTQQSYGVLPIAVMRNGYGRQYHSGTFGLCSDILPPGTTGTFIRAPRIIRTGDCEVLARRDADPVLVRKGCVLAACFHPELQSAHPVTQMFATIVRAHGRRSVAETGV